MKGIVVSYCFAIKTLIKNHDNANRAKMAFDAAKAFIQNKIVQEWLSTAESLVGEVTQDGKFITNEQLNCQDENIGHVHHGYILSFYCLLRAVTMKDEEVFDWAMEQAVMMGGDTDTNCAIVGGMIGALLGV